MRYRQCEELVPISKSNYISVLFTDIKTPCFRRSENFPASCHQRLKEFSTDVLLARDHHLGENRGPLRLGDVLLPWIPFSRKTQRHIVYGQIDIFGESVYRME